MAIIAGCLGTTQTYTTGAVATAFMFLFLDFFTSGILPVSWSYSAEIQPLRVRNKATAVGVFSHWASNFVVVMVTPIGLNSVGGHYFWIWAIICATFVPLTWIFGVETAGRSLEQIDQMFYEEPRILMGLNPNAARVIRMTQEDEENRFKAFAKLDQKAERFEEVETASK
ncbi:hypothetical protein LTR17_014570 [Elasticomyces elasticus]|nr:hypothetical protein LTR17_014570 [Elasticomyces elasticus]